MDLKVRLEFLKTYFWNIALYKCEMKTVKMLERKKIETFEIRC